MKPVLLFLWLAIAAMSGCTRPSAIKAPVAGIVLRSQQITLPYHGREFAGGPQAGVANTYCLMCHSGGMVLTQPPLPLSAWQAELNKMRRVYGCPLPESAVDDLAQFIKEQNEGAAGAAE
jgi:hypothetical protein